MSFIKKINIKKIKIPVKARDFIRKLEIPAKLERLFVKLYTFSSERSLKYYKSGKEFLFSRSAAVFERLDKKFNLRTKLKKADQKTGFSRFIEYIKQNRLMFIYLPFVGWLYPVLVKKEDELAVYHSKEAFALAVPFSVILLGLFFLTFFIPYGTRGLKLTVIILIYFVELLYLAICIMGMKNVIKGRKQVFPFADKVSSRISSIIGF